MTAHDADFIAKLVQIEELANAAHGELVEHSPILKTRMQHIVVLAKTLRGRLEFGSLAVVPIEPAARAGSPLEGGA
jgi:hypothetical protein